MLLPGGSRAEGTGPGPRWGIYQIDWNVKSYQSGLARSIDLLGSSPHYAMFYRDLRRPFWRKLCEILREREMVPVVSMELSNWHEPTEDLLSAICQGDLDEYLRSWATDALAFEDEVFLRFGFEMNGDWFPWGNRPESFITAWRRAHSLFTEVGAANVLWVWSPNHRSIPSSGDDSLERFYPGDDVVDWIGLDGYNFGDHHDPWHRWESFDEIFGPALAQIQLDHPDKPIMIAEFACAPGEPGQKAAWIRDAYRSVLRRPQIQATIWFNYDKTREGEPDWSLESQLDALTAFRETFARTGKRYSRD